MDLASDSPTFIEARTNVGYFDGRRKRPARLGDFDKVHSFVDRLDNSRDTSLDVAYGHGKPRLATLRAETSPPALLGDFHRLFSQLQAQPMIPRISQQIFPISVVHHRDWDPRQRSYVLDADLTAGSDPGLTFVPEHTVDADATYSTTLGLRDCAAPPSISSADEPSATFEAQTWSERCQDRRSDVEQVLSYRLRRNGPLISVLDQLRSRKPEVCFAPSLAPLRALDKLRAAQCPEITSNGIYVFLDMSNINISFQHNLRVKYLVDENARFSPLPTLDMRFLTEILVRGRQVIAFNAGCSVLPGKPITRYVQELRDYGYHVDLRERKRVVARPAKLLRGKAGASASSSDELPASTGRARYVEDLVDKTLQTRIAESVMEHFQTNGTIVIATGDAQPAQFSDGFLTYAERALKMGWYVEVVSWKRSLSSYWKSSGWTSQWGNSFRIIELDEFVDDLLACER